MMFTKRFRQVAGATQYSLFTYELPTSRLLAETSLGNLDELAHALYLKSIHGGAAQGDGQRQLRRLLDGLRPSHYVHLWEPATVAPNGVYWNAAAHGEIDFFQDGVGQFIDEHRREIYDSGLNSHIYLFNPIAMDFDESFFNDFDQAIENLKSVSGKVVVFYLPDFFLPGTSGISPAGQARLEEKLAKLRSDRRIIFWDYSSFPMTAENFFDISHMTKMGKELLNTRLAKSIQDLIQ